MLIVLICNLAASFATGFESGKKYRIESNFDLNSYQRSGALGLGAYHEGNSTTFYIKDGNYSEDSWWLFEQQTDGTYLIKNALSGEYMSAAKKWEDVKMLATPASNSYWHITEECGKFAMYVKGDETLLLYFGSSHNDDESATTDKKETTVPFYLFNIYNENGNSVDANDFKDVKYCGTNADIPMIKSLFDEYAGFVEINDKLVFSAIDPKESKPSFWLASKPDSGAIRVTAAFRMAYSTYQGIGVRIMDGDSVIKNGEDIVTDKAYSLNVVINNHVAATSTIYFTTMPIVDIHHEGKLTPGMFEYVWGETNISTVENPKTITLSSRYKTRGATAAKYNKQSMNVKFRNRDTDEEEDTTLFGLRSSSSWILDAMAIDRVNMRNRVCFDLWNELYKLPYETKFGSRCGTVGKFVEVIENGVYKGIYCMTDRINRKLLDLKKTATDSITGEKSARGVLYKSTSWDYTGFNTTEIDDYTGKFGDTRNSAYWCSWELAEPEDAPGDATWEPLRSIYLNQGNVKYYKDNFYMDNVRDYHLFIMAIQAEDNGNKNEFIAAQNIKKVGEDKARKFFCPWDLDASLSGNYDGSQTGGTYFPIDVEKYRINKVYPFAALLDDAEYFHSLKERWKDIRTNVLSSSNIETKMKNYADEFVNSGAWARECKYNGTLNSPDNTASALIDDLNAEIEAIGDWYDQQIYRIDDFLGVYHVGYDNISADQEKSNQIYDMLGRKLKEAPERGIFIRGGKANLIVK